MIPRVSCEENPSFLIRSVHTLHRCGRWVDQESRDGHGRERLEERVADGNTAKRAGGSGGVKQQQQQEEKEEKNEEADGGDDMDIFLRDASSTKGIHCRLGMDGVSGVFGGWFYVHGALLLSRFFASFADAMRPCCWGW